MNISPSFSRSKNKPSKKPEILCLPPAFTLISYLAYSSTVKMEAIFSTETSVDVQRITRRYIFITTGVRTSNPALLSLGFCLPEGLEGRAFSFMRIFAKYIVFSR
jgi:hypothetical protein